MALKIYNSISRKKETFEPLVPKHVGMYLCGPTVYGDPHLGHARSAVTFDVVFRYLKYLGNKVRFVRNVTDVGHLENDADHGEDKIAKKARLEQVEPMEIVQFYTVRYRKFMDAMGNLSPSIEPSATGHIIEQIDLVKRILNEDLAYESNGSVYFDVEKYASKHDYGTLSGKILEDLQSGSRELDGQDEKKSALDFALWKKASPEHIMKWESPWSLGFPGWHLECTAMSTKYLGEQFDIHGGGMDLQFPHHEAELAQNQAAFHKHPAKYWMHNNMLTINGKKMSKSLGNFITLEEMFAGSHELLEQAYSPMTVRFFILQAHYRSTVDFSNTALQAAEKGYHKLAKAVQFLKETTFSASGNGDGPWDDAVAKGIADLYATMDDDFNTARCIAALFDLSTIAFNIQNGVITPGEISSQNVALLQKEFVGFFEEVLGFQPEIEAAGGGYEGAVEVLIDMRNQARKDKNFQLSDAIRDQLLEKGIVLKDGKEGTTFALK